MADVKISELPAGTPTTGSILPATNAAGNLTEKVTVGAVVDLARTNTVTSPAELTADANDYAPAAGDIYRVTSDAARSVTGLAASSDGDAKLFVNVGAHAITFKHEDAGSTAANRFVVPWAGDYVLSAGGGAALVVYDATSARWRVV